MTSEPKPGVPVAVSPNGIFRGPDVLGTSPEDGDLLDVDALKLSPDALDGIDVRKVLTTVPVKRPHRQQWLRVHPDPEWRLDALVLQLKDDDREIYLVSPTVFDLVAEEVAPTRLYTSMTRAGVLFLWPVRLPGADGRLDAWSQSAHVAADRAMTRWTRVASNRALGAYEILEVSSGVAIPEPAWPTEVDFRRVLTIAFHGRFINSDDHPVLRQLQGRS